MKYKLMTWNINFLHDNWLKRLNTINKTLEKELEECDVITLQEATLPFSNTIETIHDFLKRTDMEYFMTSLMDEQKLRLYKKVQEFFPKRKLEMTFVMEYLMNKLMWFCGYIYSKWGEKLKELYFNHPYIIMALCVLCPFVFMGSTFFFGMLTIVNKKSGKMRSKCIGRRIIQYIEMKMNGRDAIIVNIHLSPGKSKWENAHRLREIKEIYNLVKDKEISILMGDFNSAETDCVYKFLKKRGYKSCVKEKLKTHMKTFPSENPKRCIDFVMYKGLDIDVIDVEIFGTKEETDHKGIKVTLDVK